MQIRLATTDNGKNPDNEGRDPQDTDPRFDPSTGSSGGGECGPYGDF